MKKQIITILEKALTTECTFKKVQECLNEIKILHQRNSYDASKIIEGEVTISIPNLIESLCNIFSYERDITDGDRLAIIIIKELIGLC